MQHAIDDAKNINFKCRTCNALTECCITYGKHILIDTSIFTDYTYINNKSDVTHDLNSIAKVVTLNNINYILAGTVHYIKGYDKNRGHYVAFAYVGSHWYEYDDLKEKAYNRKSNARN